jgi:hypothetical protein
VLKPKSIPDHTGEFLNELFDDVVREPTEFLGAIDKAIDDNQTIAWLIGVEERELLVDTLVRIMTGEKKEAEVSAEDWALMRFFGDYIQKKNLVMSVPKLTLKRKGPPAQYQLDSYTRVALCEDGKFNRNYLADFVHLFLAGAHFVVLRGGRNLDFYADFGKQFYSWTGKWTGAVAGAAVGHSHYGNAITNLRSAYAYPNRWSNLGLSADNRWPLVPIVIVDATANKSARRYETFFQMEGWSTSILGSLATRKVPLLGLNLARYAFAAWLVPSLALPYAAVATVLDLAVLDWPASRVAKGGVRHGVDFDTHNLSKWNISTYGASVYSEKRGTTVFLHDSETVPARSGTKVMFDYAGAQKPEQYFLI